MGDIKYFSFLSCVFDWENGKVEGFKILLFGLKKIMFKKLLVHNIYIYIYIFYKNKNRNKREAGICEN